MFCLGKSWWLRRSEPVTLWQRWGHLSSVQKPCWLMTYWWLYDYMVLMNVNVLSTIIRSQIIIIYIYIHIYYPKLSHIHVIMWSYEMWMTQSQGTRSPSKGFDNPLLWNVVSGHVGVSPSDVMTVWKGQSWCDVSFLELFQGITFLRYFDYMSLICRAQWCIFMHFLRIAIYQYLKMYPFVLQHLQTWDTCAEFVFHDVRHTHGAKFTH